MKGELTNNLSKIQDCESSHIELDECEDDEDEDEDELILMARQKLLELKRDLSDDEQDFQDTSQNFKKNVSESESDEAEDARQRYSISSKKYGSNN